MNSRQQRRTRELALKTHRLLHRMDDLNAQLGDVLREYYEITGEPIVANMIRVTEHVKTEFRGYIQ
jgi:hypothetical protein